ncbi:hypothetical protein LIS90_13215 [Flavobacterium psychrophilum]|uniref:site-2 protease family protein n=1 Tax=Flavobacterium psychrophilum TaxID=96345 RepID=UPI001D0829AB|nr:site-2 protease family protein [Flavobacterium psychrophilum]MCB6232205.1 hypothetical protein [Flavobacterium psychrophilum]
MNYNKIQIHKTEFDDNYILIYDNQTLSVGYIVKIIVEYLQDGIIDSMIIKEKLFFKNSLEININEIDIIVEKISVFINNKNKHSFTKLFKIFNPSIINLNRLNFLFTSKIFYVLFLITLLINITFTYKITKHQVNNDSHIIWLILTLLILFLHELGHAISANKFNIKCDEIGLGLYLIFPVLYINLGESWKLEKNKRIIINLSGIYFQLIIGAIIGFLAVFHITTLFSHLFYTNLTVLLLNFNPLIKFDGYWVLADIMNIKDLSKKADETLKKIKHLEFSKLKNWLIIYTLFRTLFFLYIIYFLFNSIIKILLKLYKFEELSNYQYFLVIIIIAVLLKKIKNELKTRKSRI